MGYAIAEVCAAEGAEVILVSGPVDLDPVHPNITRIPVVSAAEMYDACMDHFKHCDIGIMAAAVADFTPSVLSGTKVKRGKDSLDIRLVPTNDIAAELGKMKNNSQLLIGFALETDQEMENATSKLRRKNLDMIVLNSLRDEGAGFGTDTNKITIIDKNNNIDIFELKSKTEVARDIVDAILRIS